MGAASLVLMLASCTGSAPGQDPSASGSAPSGSTPTGPTTPTAARSAAPSPDPSADPLTGGTLSDHPVIAVKIDNVATARPQVGLGSADLVVVERVEANLTRMIGVFHSRFPRRVGPVRSARNTDLQLLGMFGRPGLVYSGANAKVQAQVRRAPVVAIERSDRDRSRIAPHNVIVNLARIEKRTKLRRAEPIGLVFSSDGWSSAARDGSTTVRIGADRFGFVWADGRYRTSWNGRADTDGGRPVTADNVIVMDVRTHRDRDTTSDISEVSETVGRGRVSVYSGGRVRTGAWSRSASDAPLLLRNREGRKIGLAEGRTWILLRG